MHFHNDDKRLQNKALSQKAGIERRSKIIKILNTHYRVGPPSIIYLKMKKKASVFEESSNVLLLEVSLIQELSSDLI